MQHNSGKLKQTNKSHKGIVTSKRAQKRALGPGKVASIKSKRHGSVTSDATSRSDSTSNRLNRINQSQQLKKKKRDTVLLMKRVGSQRGPPKIVAIIPLSEHVNPQDLMNCCLREGTTSSNIGSNSSVYFSQFKAHITFITAELDVMSVLDAAKVADIIILVGDAGSDELISDMGAICLSAMKAQGCPDLMCCMQGYESFTGKALIDRKKTIIRICETEVTSYVKVLEFSNNGQMSDDSRNASVSHICRQLCSMSPKDIGWRSIRSYLLSQTCELLPKLSASDEEGKSTESIRVTGFLRGRPLPVNSLVHIVGVGTGRIKEITVGGNKAHSNSADTALMLTAVAENQDSLVLEATADGLSGEQTWPTEAEMNMGDSALETMDSNIGRNRRIVPTNIPAGMSAYQADWFVDDEGHGDFDEDYQNAADGENSKMQDEGSVVGNFEEDDNDNDNASMMEGSIANTVTFPGHMDKEQSAGVALAEKRRLRTLAQAKDDKEFPDELDTPADVTARLRFARYRALQSFRSSPWHPKENLPTDYARIYQFENFGSAQRRILAEGKMLECRQKVAVLSSHHATSSALESIGEADEMCLDDADEDTASVHSMRSVLTSRTGNTAPCLVPGTVDIITSGQYVTIDIEYSTEHARAAMQKLRSTGSLAVFSLLKHENKLSIMHCNVQRNEMAGDTSIIKSKEELYFQIGFRTFPARPIFSEANLNCEKHKFERFWLNDRFSVASIYAPITFHPSPVLVFKRTPVPMPDGGAALGFTQEYKMTLVGTGSLGGVDPDRIILKKVILTGHPIRVRKKFAVVKHMFYDPMDVRWFKPAEMVTKHGLRGHIKEPVGTHGLLKAAFSAPIKQNDTVMLILYKRVYPKLPLEMTSHDISSSSLTTPSGCRHLVVV